jgi:hypothetical protein
MVASCAAGCSSADGAGGAGSVVEVVVVGASVVLVVVGSADVTVVSDDDAACGSVVAARAGSATAAVAITAPVTMSPAVRRTRRCRSVERATCLLDGAMWRPLSGAGGRARVDGLERESLGGFVIKPQTRRNPSVAYGHLPRVCSDKTGHEHEKTRLHRSGR